MKVGIITYYDVTNYGSFLLAYAMQHTLTELGHEAVFLKYVRHKDVENKRTFMGKLRSFSPNAIKARNAEKAKIKVFEECREKYLNVGDYYDAPQDLDCIICGSDQIFDCKYEFNAFQFAIDAPCRNKISYAPSFGEFLFSDLENFRNVDRLKDALSDFKAHSARDDNTLKIIESLTGKRPIRVVDPAILYGYKDEKKIWNDILVKDRYMIIYTWGGTTASQEFVDNVKTFAKKNDLKTVSVGDRRPWCDIDYSSASPIEFFELYQHCDMVITNMFHGTCFSILNRKPFYSLVMPHNKNKLGNLLQSFGLEKQAVTDLKDIGSKCIPIIDYKKAYEEIERQKQISIQYLQFALEV